MFRLRRDDVHSRCARAVRGMLGPLADALAAAGENRFEEPAEVVRQRVAEALLLFARGLEGDATSRTLYAGQRMFELFRAERSHAENVQACRDLLRREWAVMSQVTSARLSDDDLQALEAAFREATAGLCGEPAHHVRTLFVGDCLMAEVLGFLVGALAGEGVSIDPSPVNSRSLAQIEPLLDEQARRGCDVVFVSPFSHARLAEIEALLLPRTSLAGGAHIDALVARALEQTEALLDALGRRFECPIYVHNAALVQRSTHAAKIAVKSAATWRARSRARGRIGAWLDRYVAQQNATTFRHWYVLDEAALFARRGLALGRNLHASAFQHATVMSRELAEEYRLRISTLAHLADKKIVVCDLDNTLWDGLIGEGAVRPFVERQRTLKALKEHGGVVLSIASKNDPANVVFDGEAVLREADFVLPQIGWDPKPAAIGAITQRLNLQPRHLVFIDDRPDERALVKDAWPDVLALDATDETVWQRMALWAQLAHGSSELDRTALYRQQLEREASDAPSAPAERRSDWLASLGLKISVVEAQKGDLKRVVELVNRTNQWNLCGTRTSYAEVRAWHAGPASCILLAKVEDRFGDLGTVCAAVVTLAPDEVHIPAFVLSCRVFGYGVETAMLDEIARRFGADGQRRRLVGHARVTAQNRPCRAMYADHGFAPEGDGYVRPLERPVLESAA
jgi:FkbH-like protein